MANYFIVGGDQKEYGPITAEDIRLWIAEGRLNAHSSARGESDTSWRPLGTFAEFSDAFHTAPPTIAPLSAAASASNDEPTNVNFLERDYELDIGGCVTRSWEVLKKDFGNLFGGFLVAMGVVVIASLAIGGLGTLILPESLFHSEIFRQIFNLFYSAVLALVAGPMMAGLYYLFIRANRGQSVSISDVFIGYQKNFKELYLGYLAVALLVGLCMIPYSVINDTKLLPITEQMRHASPADVQALLPQMWAALFSTLPVLFICLIPVTYLSVNWQFTLPLIIDKKMPFLTAMKTSWKMVHKHWWQVFGLTIVVGLVSVAGILGCCVGVLVTIPIGMGAMMIGYETIFGERKN
jgi:uncharacterized membrane protein